MSLYKKYIEEKYSDKIVWETPNYLTQFQVYEDRSILVEVLYVDKGARNRGTAQRLFTDIVAKYNPKAIFCSVDLLSNSWQDTLYKFTQIGPFKITYIDEDKCTLGAYLC